MKRKLGFCYEYPRPGVTVDIALFRVAGELHHLRLQVLLIERGVEPHLAEWALPGGFVREHEDLDSAAMRELKEETGLEHVVLHQVRAVGTPHRDTRGHVITVVYTALVPGGLPHVQGGGDAAKAAWFELGSGLPTLAFDHGILLDQARQELREQLAQTPLCFQLLPEQFTLSELQAVCEAIMGQPLDRRNFRRRVQELELVEEVIGAQRKGKHRPAKLFRHVAEAFTGHLERKRGLPF